MKTFYSKVIGIVCVLTMLIALQASVFAKNENAPGQVKKQTNAENNGQTQSPRQGEGNSQKTTIQNAKESGKENKMIKNEEKLIDKKNKRGASELKDLLEKLNSESSGLDRTIGKLTKVKVSVASSSAQLKRHAVSGIITELGDGVLTLVHQIHRDRVYTIIVDDLTVIAMKGEEAATFANLAVGQRVAVVGEPTDNGLHAKRVHVIPGKAIGIFEKQPLGTPSGTLTATPSVTDAITSSPTLEPTATPTPTP